MRVKTAHVILVLLVFSLSSACHTAKSRNRTEVLLDVPIPKLATVEDVIQWSEKNLYFKNVDPWDPPPEVSDVIKNGYGDCKMLAGVVSVLLDSVGKKNLFIVIKSRDWHMFNAYEEDEKWRVVNNARLLKRTFANLDEIKSYFKVRRFEKTFNSYKDFRRWFNEEIYPRRGR